MHEWRTLNVIIWNEWANRKARTGSTHYIAEFYLLTYVWDYCFPYIHNITITLRYNYLDQHFLVPQWQDWDLTLSSFRLSVPFVVLWCRQLSSLLLSNLLGSSTVPVVFFYSIWDEILICLQFEYLQEWLEIILLTGQQALSTWEICVSCSEMVITEEG